MQSSNRSPLYFASGSNRAADVRGFSAVGQAIGVAAPEVSPAAEAAIIASSVPVFVDSGAFSEVRFTPAGVVVVKAITDAEWRKRLALYLRLARAMGSRLSVVAPDRIGDQELTLERLTTYAPELEAIAALGARVLVPIQKGAMSQAMFVRDVQAVLRFDFVHAIPSKKEATTMAELEAYVTEVRPAAVHLLGLGIKNALASTALAILERAGVAVVSLDSNMIAANVGRSERTPRRLTAARDRAAGIIARGETAITSAQELGIILAFGDAHAIARALTVRLAA
jgi:hypothetical protein